MLSLLERNVAAIERRLVLLAPPEGRAESALTNVTLDESRHRYLVAEIQRLRGAVYLSDGAVGPQQLSGDGRHHTPEDERSWHLLMLNARGGVSSCVWYLEHDDAHSLSDLRVRDCPLGDVAATRDTFARAIEDELDRARRERLRYAEVGGWAVTRESRCTAEGLLLALAAYSLGRAFGGALGLTTATVRHSSSTILRRLGGSHLVHNGVAVPSYFDSRYGCEMELLRFDSRFPSAKYERLIELLRHRLVNVPVITRHRSVWPATRVPVAAA
jgi:hypothetical protein